MSKLVPFENKTYKGNELAIKRGLVVPEDAVNLAYSETLRLTPANNIVIIDTSRIIDENLTDVQPIKKLMYANSIGILEDDSGNQLVEDEFPIVTDIFSVEEDWSIVPGSEYLPQDILPYLHVSRFFHIDFSGLTIGSGPDDYTTNSIKIIDDKGRIYVDENGNPRYRIKIAPALNASSGNTRQHAYRVLAFVDTNANESLYLTYNKVEIDTLGKFKHQQINYRELLNPTPFFDQRLEESEVVDPHYRDKKWFAVESVTLTDEALKIPSRNVNGYRIYVPRKAVLDTRVFQTFRWRVSCTFIQDFQVESETGKVITATSVTHGPQQEEVFTSVPTGKIIRCGIVVTNSDPTSYTPYAFLNLGRSSFNRVKAIFQNPLRTNHSSTTQESASYWYVNLNTVSDTDLAKFDILIWSPKKQLMDFTPYLSKIRYFVNTLGRTLFIDSNDNTVLQNIEVVTSSPVTSKTGTVSQSAGNSYTSSLSVNSFNIVPPDPTQPLIHASNFSGWELTGNALKTLTALQNLYSPGYSQYVGSAGTYTTVLSGTRADNFASEAATVFRESTQSQTSHKKGNIIISTIGHLFTCSAFFSSSGSLTLINANQGSKLYSTANYKSYINSGNIEGAMKFFFNVVMLAVQQKTLAVLDVFTQRTVDTGEKITYIQSKDYASSWTYATDWFPSWAVDGTVLTDLERNKYDFSLLPADVNNPTPVWQRKLSAHSVDQLMEAALTPDMKKRIRGATRNYVIEVTNSNVSVPVTLGPRSLPYAWTDAYSPPFQIPPDMGPNIIREREIPAKYSDGQYTFRQYPAKPYNCQVRAFYDVNDQFNTTETVHWSITGTATETVTITEAHPPVTTTTTSEIGLTWVPNGDGVFNTELILAPEFGLNVPSAVKTWAEDNYYAGQFGPGQQCWPFWGPLGQWYQGTSGQEVGLIQNALNGLGALNYFGMPYGLLAQDGSYGPKTAATVRSFQNTFRARYLDGVVDAETWSILGAQIMRSGRSDGMFGWTYSNIRRENISNGMGDWVYAKRSWVRKGPSVIWDLFSVALPQNYWIHAITVIPFTGGGPPLLVTNVDCYAGPEFPSYGGSDPSIGLYSHMGYRVGDNQPFRLDFAPRFANVVTVGLAQDLPTYEGARIIGVRDIIAHAEVTNTVTTPGWTQVIKQTKTIPLSDSGTAHVTAGHDVVIHPTIHYSGRGVLSNIKWLKVVSDNSNVTVKFDANRNIVLSNHLVVTHANTGFTFGPNLPTDLTYYSIDEHGRYNPVRETGWVSKDEGIKLLCDNKLRPVGFPALPTGSAADDGLRFYTQFSLTSYGNDAHVMVSFYDINKQEFIVDRQGKPVIPYLDYVRRGPQNIYIGVISTYELDTKLPIPTADDAPKLPFLSCLPVYGVEKKPRTKITLEPLPPNLGVEDIWPVAVRIGEFDRPVAVRSRLAGPITTFLKDYQGTVVTAHYSIPEAQIGGWSLLYGYPNSDVIDETPIILDDNLLQVRQPPIKLMSDPSVFPSPADPKRPVLQVSHRESVNDSWVNLQYSDLADWNISTGEIYLKNPMTIDDPWLWKVSYTSEQRDYYLKKTEDGILNLNPYPGHTRDLIGKPIHVYMLPEYVKDQKGNMISGSLRDRTLRFSLSSDIFDPVRPNYDPLAIQLGVVYISTALDETSLAILDSRKRGGGAKDSAAITELMRIIKDAASYWDAGYAAGMSYQKGGFVIIRLPVHLKNDLNEAQINETIQHNISAGVKYKLEDLHGNDWS